MAPYRSRRAPPDSRSRSYGPRSYAPRRPPPSDSDPSTEERSTDSDEEEEPRRKPGRGERRGTRYRQPDDSFESTDDDDASPGSESEDDDDKNLVGPEGGRGRPRRPPPYSKAPPPNDSTKRIILWLGITVIICLAALGIVAIVKYVGNNSATAAEPVTITITEQNGQLSTTTLAASQKATTAKASGTVTSGGAKSTAASNSSSTATGGATTFPGLSKNGIGIGFIPDYGYKGGDYAQTLMQINEGLGIKSSFHGWYAQLPASDPWDGGQILGGVFDDVKASGAIFQPAVMPTQGWNGLTADNNFQALAIAKVMKKFTDEGIEVWLRFAHEVNWYQSPDDPDKTYQGGVDDFKKGWAAVAAAVKDNPLVKMFFTPNVAGSVDQYIQYFPDDLSTVHIIGIDYYPRSSGESFTEHMLPFYNKYCTDGTIKFAMGETGTMWDATPDERLAWMDQLTSAETAKAMPHYIGATWFNYNKEQYFDLWAAKDEDGINAKAKAWFAEGTEASGAAMGNA